MVDTSVGVRDEPDAPLAEIAVESITTLNGGPTAAKDVQRAGLTLITAPGAAADVSAANPVPVSAAALPLPTGAATAAAQATMIGHLDGVEGALATAAQETTLATIAARLGARTLTPAAPANTAVGAASGALLAADPNRKRVTLVNHGAQMVSLGFATAAVLGAGITLMPGGGTATIDEKDEGTAALQGAINAIAGGAGSNVGVQAFT